MKRFLLALALCLAIAAPARAASFKSVEKSVFLLYTRDFVGNMNFNCTATAYGDPNQHRFLTAAHCVTVPKDKKLVLNPSQFFLSDEKGTFTKAEVKAWGNQDEGFDFAILVSPLVAQTVKLGDERKCSQGDDIFNVAGAAGLGVQFFKGYISSLSIDRPLIDPDEHINWSGFLGLVMHSSGGSSGSAIFNTNAEIIGVLVGGYKDITTACPISRVVDFLEHEPKK